MCSEELTGSSIHSLHALFLKLILWVGSLFLKLIRWMGWLFLQNFKVIETVTVSDMCIHNVALLIASLLRGRIDLEMDVKDLMVTLRGSKLKEINGFGLTRNTHV